MGRHIILCSDGTCNAFGGKHSNVAKLLQLIKLNAPEKQIVIYDQGIGTKKSEFERIKEWKDKLLHTGEVHNDAFCLLQPPDYGHFFPISTCKRIRAMVFGDGLEVNIKQLYIKLAEIYETGDKLFFFGFSRGAFTVRALAGLLWRYGLPDKCQADKVFNEAWKLFRDEFPDEKGENRNKALEFRNNYDTRDYPVEFLGLWDTVKSYGGMCPVMLPHLRHNPSVSCVRHALALDEERGWFDVTQWGWLDSDREDACKKAAVTRLDPADRNIISSHQDVEEVWFAGTHSDIGGDNNNRDTSDIALRWMLGEAKNKGLLLDRTGECFLSFPVSREHPDIQSSRSFWWKIIDSIPRRTIDNSGKWPKLIRTRGAAKRLQKLTQTRDNKTLVHESVPVCRRPPLAYVSQTKRFPIKE